MLVKALRNGLGMLIVFANWLTLPKKVVRTPEQQQWVDEQAGALKLYQFNACPFCVKVRRHLHRLNVPVALVEAGQWLYESSAIIEYLDGRFAPQNMAV